MTANASSTSPPEYDTEAWSNSREGCCNWNWKNEQKETIDFLEREIALIEERLNEVESETLSAELKEFKRRLPIIKQKLAKSPSETRKLWNQAMYDGEYYRYVY